MRPLILALLLAASPASALAASCSDRIAFVQRVINRDVKTGFVDKKVHDAMGKDLADATQACKSGNDAKAQALITATQRRHGYPARDSAAQ